MKGIAESFSDNLFEDVPDLFFIHDLEGKISYVNRYAFQLMKLLKMNPGLPL